MAQTLHYGLGSTIEIDLPDEVLVADCSRPQAKPIDDPSAAVAAAVDDPLDFPALAQAIIAGDRVAIVLEPGLPQAASLVAGIVHSLSASGINPSDIVVLCAAKNTNGDEPNPTSLLPLDFREAVQTMFHDPTDSRGLAYLAASKNGEPIYLNRNICDADVVIPLGLFKLDADLNHIGVHTSFIRWFSDAAAARRLSDSCVNGTGNSIRQLREETDEAAWLLGVQFTVQVIPGPGDTILHVLAGDANSVAAQGRALCESAWRFDVPRRANLVVATIEGDQTQQTWENFSRALSVTSRAVADDGAIVICTDLRSCPVPAAVASGDFHDDDDRSIEPQEESSFAAEQAFTTLLASTQRRSRVFLLSGLENSVVEDLGLGIIESDEEVVRLSSQYESCILVAGAQNAVLVARDD